MIILALREAPLCFSVNGPSGVTVLSLEDVIAASFSLCCTVSIASCTEKGGRLNWSLSPGSSVGSESLSATYLPERTCDGGAGGRQGSALLHHHHVLLMISDDEGHRDLKTPGGSGGSLMAADTAKTKALLFIRQRLVAGDRMTFGASVKERRSFHQCQKHPLCSTLPFSRFPFIRSLRPFTPRPRRPSLHLSLTLEPPAPPFGVSPQEESSAPLTCKSQSKVKSRAGKKAAGA